MKPIISIAEERPEIAAPMFIQEKLGRCVCSLVLGFAFVGQRVENSGM